MTTLTADLCSAGTFRKSHYEGLLEPDLTTNTVNATAQHFYFSCSKTVEPLPLLLAFGLKCIAEEGMMFALTKESATRIF